jgi:TonB family protein
MTPEEAAGSGLAPSVSVRVRVDQRGKVDSVEVLRVEPSSELDASFTTATIEGLSEWRYAPARSDGRPVAATLEWTMQFMPRMKQLEEERSRRPGYLLIREEEARSQYRWEVLALPPQQRLKLQREQVLQAEACLDKASRQEHKLGGFVVVTDSKIEGLAEKTAGNLAACYVIVNEMWAEKVAPRPVHGDLVAYVFSTQEAYRKFSGTTKAYEWAEAFYSPLGLIALHTEMPTNEHLLSAMLHEAVHAVIDRHLLRPGARIPRWLDEGLATYVGNSEVRRGKLVPGRYRRSQIYHGPRWAASGRSMAWQSIDAVKKAVRKGKAIPLDKLVSAEYGEFYGEEREMFYSQASMLVHFLRHGRASWTKEAFPLFLLYVAEGYPAEDAFVRAYGTTPSGLEDEFKRYMEKY